MTRHPHTADPHGGQASTAPSLTDARAVLADNREDIGMTMKISQLISCLKAAQERHGDLPVYTVDSDIKAVDIAACRDGVQRTTNGKPDEPNELVISFVPCD